MYILTGLLPIETQIRKKTITFFNNVCRQSHDPTEKRLAIRQITVKTLKSNSWFISVKKLLWKYDLGEIDTYLNDPPTKLEWKTLINKTLNCYWKRLFVQQANLHKTLKYINLEEYRPGMLHTLLQLEPKSARDVNRIPAKLKMLCGTLQSTRTSCNQSTVNPVCQLCNTAEETLENFILNCSVLKNVSTRIISDINTELIRSQGVNFHGLSEDAQIQIILDCKYSFEKSQEQKVFY